MLVFLKQGFDCLLKGLLFYNRQENVLKKRLADEVLIHESTKTKHFIGLLQVNHQRVSASISHISIMIAVLLFSYNFIFKESRIGRPIVSVEIILYLFLTVALLRCLRDFGLDEDYFHKQDDPNAKQAYENAFHDEIAFRYAILRVCNTLIIAVTLLFAVLLAFYFIL